MRCTMSSGTAVPSVVKINEKMKNEKWKWGMKNENDKWKWNWDRCCCRSCCFCCTSWNYHKKTVVTPRAAAEAAAPAAASVSVHFHFSFSCFNSHFHVSFQFWFSHLFLPQMVQLLVLHEMAKNTATFFFKAHVARNFLLLPRWCAYSKFHYKNTFITSVPF